MSRLLPDLFTKFLATRLIVSLSADGIAIAQANFGLKKWLSHPQYFANQQAKNSADWQSILNQLDDSLNQLNLAKNTHVTVVLSTDFVRYLVLPAQHIAMNFSEKMAYLQATYRDIYGAMADNWQIKCHDSAPSENMLAVAVDAQLMNTLSQIIARHQLNLHSAQPYLMAVFNSLMPQISRKSGYLVLLEQAKFLLIQLHNGKCQHLRTIHFQQDWQLGLQQAIQRENALNEHGNDADNSVWIYAPTQKNVTIHFTQGFKAEKIELKKGLSTQLNNPQFYMLEAVL